MNSTPVLTAHIFISTKLFKKIESFQALQQRLADNYILAHIYTHKDKEITDKTRPHIYVSIGESSNLFPYLLQLPLCERKKWLHFNTYRDVKIDNLFYCWLLSTETLLKDTYVPRSRFTSETPKISVFTAAHNSNEKIERPLRSLLKQSYSNWEWVIVDDSPDESHKELETKFKDPRIRLYQQKPQSGFIGKIKRAAAGLCTGEILLELDHDDELTPDCLEKIVKAFLEHPECGFAYGESTEVYWENKLPHNYDIGFGFGFGTHYKAWVHQMHKWQNVLNTAHLNWKSIRHLVGLPNHPRAWTRECYHLIGGHRPELLVADDYDILVRTFLKTRFLKIPELLYIQYRNTPSDNQRQDNTTFTRNAQIQKLCHQLEKIYKDQIDQRIAELGLPTLDWQEQHKVWELPEEHPETKHATLIAKHRNKTAFVFIEPYGRTELLSKLQEGVRTKFKSLEIIIIGKIPNELEKYATLAPMGAIRWWPMDSNQLQDRASCLRYAKLCSSCKNIIEL